MPLLNGRSWQSSGVPEVSADNEQLFYLQLTGEAFRDYKEYVARRELYASRTWTSGYWDDTHHLTLEEAMHQDCLGQSLAGKVCSSSCLKHVLDRTSCSTYAKVTSPLRDRRLANFGSQVSERTTSNNLLPRSWTVTPPKRFTTHMPPPLAHS